MKAREIKIVKSTIASHGDDFWKDNSELFDDIVMILNNVGLDLELKDEFKVGP